ncbi:Kinesin-like protein 5 [Smittium mucronatum]|uniref:Kinesin-like protein 5 n=1 Tax=Smittium mucronatum TaxID=133383 RepID=A0A1R0GRX0_9FUNG|nr:Kinesin-like protein 5 [Smittium mucronatum]
MVTAIDLDTSNSYRNLELLKEKSSIESIEMVEDSNITRRNVEPVHNIISENIFTKEDPTVDPNQQKSLDKHFSQSSILVAVRVRPFSKKELCNMIPSEVERYGYLLPDINEINSIKSNMGTWGNSPIWKSVVPIDKNVLVFDPPNDDDDFGTIPNSNNIATKPNFRNVRNFRSNSAPVAASNQKHKDLRFVFDQVYNEDSTQQEVFQGTTQSLIYSVMEGYNATVFAYGATGCGKTYTISGTNEDPGIIYLTMKELFKKMELESETKEIESTVSYLEVYNETIIDLISSNKANSNGLSLREDNVMGVTVAGLSEHKPKNVDEVMDLVNKGNQNRTMSPTEANAASSRSHAVLQIRIRQKSRNSGINANMLTATLSIIDLAGSERATVTQNKGDRMREGANINRSLLALANCINALSDPKKGRHIPYRDSKLTRLLKFSLGGNCRTVMITCVSPSSTYYEETHNTLKYASRAKNIRTTLNKNTSSSKMHISQYTKKIQEQSLEIRRLQKEISDLKRNSSNSTSSANKYGNYRNANSNTQQQSSFDNRRKIAAEQLVQDIRNKMSQTISSACSSQYDWASGSVFNDLFTGYQNTLKYWREKFDSSGNQPGQSFLSNSASETYRKRIDELLRNLAQQGKKASRYADHAFQASQRFQYNAKKISTSTNPSQGLTDEQKQRIDQELKILQLTSEKKGLQRQTELLLNVSSGYADEIKNNSGLNAMCLSGMKSVVSELKELKQLIPIEVNTVPLNLDQIIEYLNNIYIASLQGFSQSTSKIESTINLVLNNGGPSKIDASLISSNVTSPKNFQSGRNNNSDHLQFSSFENSNVRTKPQLPPIPNMNSNNISKSSQRKEMISMAINNMKSSKVVSPRVRKSRASILGTYGHQNLFNFGRNDQNNYMSPSKRKLENPIIGNSPNVRSSVTYTSAIRRSRDHTRRSSLSSNHSIMSGIDTGVSRKRIKSEPEITGRVTPDASYIGKKLDPLENPINGPIPTRNRQNQLHHRKSSTSSLDLSRLNLTGDSKSQSVTLISPNSTQMDKSRVEAAKYNPLNSDAVPKKGILKNSNR